MHEVQIQRTNARGEKIIFCSKVVYKVETSLDQEFISVCWVQKFFRWCENNCFKLDL